MNKKAKKLIKSFREFVEDWYNRNEDKIKKERDVNFAIKPHKDDMKIFYYFKNQNLK